MAQVRNRSRNASAPTNYLSPREPGDGAMALTPPRRSRSSRVIAAALLAAAGLALVGLIFNPTYEPEPAAASVVSANALEPVTGVAPIDRIVSFWSERADRSPSDYLNRTQHGHALLVQARENADLDTYASAEAAFKGALERNDQHEAAQLGLAQALHAQHRFTEAKEVAETVLAASPDSWPARLLAADAKFELGFYQEAVTAYDDLLGEQRSAQLLSRAARVASLAGDHEAAVALAQDALRIGDTGAQRPNTAAFFRFQIAHFQAEAGDFDAALVSLDQALDIDATHVGAVELSASLLFETGRLKAAAESYERVLELAPAADLYGSYAEVLVALGEEELAAENEAIARELAYETIDSQPAERRHVAQFFLTRDPAVALDLALLDLQERSDIAAWELLATAHDAAGNTAHADAAQTKADELRAVVAQANR